MSCCGDPLSFIKPKVLCPPPHGSLRLAVFRSPPKGAPCTMWKLELPLPPAPRRSAPAVPPPCGGMSLVTYLPIYTTIPTYFQDTAQRYSTCVSFSSYTLVDLSPMVDTKTKAHFYIPPTISRKVIISC